MGFGDITSWVGGVGTGWGAVTWGCGRGCGGHTLLPLMGREAAGPFFIPLLLKKKKKERKEHRMFSSKNLMLRVNLKIPRMINSERLN